MAYAAVTCLYHRIDDLLNSPQTCVASSTKKILRSAGQSAKRLQRTLQRYDEIKNNSQGVMGVDARIRDEACRLEDAIESAASAQFLLQSDQSVLGDGRLYLRLHHLKHEIYFFVETAKKMRAEYMEELHKKQLPPHEEEEEAAVSSISGNDDDCDMVGSPDYFLQIRDLFTTNGPVNLYSLVEITGMAGIGKTRLVKKLFHDHLVKEIFDCRALVTMGHKYEFEGILGAMISQLNADNAIVQDEDENASEFFKRILRGRKFLIVLDDVWDASFEREFTPLLPEDCGGNGSFVMITSRIDGIITTYTRYTCRHYAMSLLNDEESWELLQKKVFREKDDCPPLLEKAGKKIAEKCEGLPLLIITVAKLLSEPEREKTPEYWMEVAEMRNSLLVDAMDQIYEVIARSYLQIIQNSKACFLYMGVFPHDYVIRHSRITNLWLAERFADGFHDMFYYLVRNSLVVVREYRFRWLHKPKSCNLHVVYRHLTKREGENIQFLHILSRYDTDPKRLKGMRRLAIYHNTLLAIKELYNSIASLPTLRSVLCTGPYLQYQVPICCQLKLLRVLDALTVRFYEFPVEVVKLIQLKYLSLSTNANLPPSISKLFFLEYLIVQQHSNIINWPACHVYVPVEIWDMKELVHLQIGGRNLPHPPPGAILTNLSELLDVGAQTCAKEVLESVPYLEKLTIQIKSAPDAAQTIGMNYCFDHIFSLGELACFRTSVINPKLFSKTRVQPQLPSFYSFSLRKLSLSGFGYPWEDMSIIAQLPQLEVLKLRSFAFRGEKWKAEEMRFSCLFCLLIEDTDLAKWTARVETFPCLYVLTMKHCYKLKEFPHLKALSQIVLVDCNPLTETWANQTAGSHGVQLENSWK